MVVVAGAAVSGVGVSVAVAGLSRVGTESSDAGSILIVGLRIVLLIPRRPLRMLPRDPVLPRPLGVAIEVWVGVRSSGCRIGVALFGWVGVGLKVSGFRS